uniref:Uncharacterized protein n=1 Tax=Siphoviridae sp. ctAUQ2 TaxID=2826182 RepID=A0A8S5MYS0_9CAUD|nr:MAG TPA: hypothetical protein [Siphoviridae sp. ctAUQ2]
MNMNDLCWPYAIVAMAFTLWYRYITGNCQ